MSFEFNGSGAIRPTRLPWLLLALLVLVAAPALAQINTIPAWNGTDFISSFGVPNTATYGQTITVAANSTALQSFSFEVGNCGASVTMRGEVYAWGTNQATGAALYESAPVTIAASSAFQLVTFTPGGLSLPAGTYVLFASTSRDQSGAPSSACRWGSVVNTNIPNGNFVFINNTADPTQWTGGTWSFIASDLAMSVSGLVPPAIATPAASTTSLLILSAALLCFGLFKLSRRRHHAV
jgi:hypothetical protein